MGVSKVEIMENGTARTIMDLTGDTVTPEALAEGYTAHNATGEPIHGEMKTTTVLYTEQNLTTEQKTQARENIGASSVLYGVCDTAADVADKVVTVDGSFVLKEGAFIIVRFLNANSIAAPTLNVNGTGAKPMYRYGTTTMSTGTTTTGWVAGAIQMFTYNGEGWIRDYWNNTTYSNVALGQGYTTCSTEAATTAKTATLSSYSLTAGGIVAVKFTNAVPANATLNINSKGAKAIYYRGAKITADVIKAGDTATFIYNTYYHLISIDRWQDDISELREEIDDLSVIVTPQMYGAKGDGVTDDTIAFENALAENTNIFVPTGNYVITRPLDLTYKKSLVSDDGQNPTIIFAGNESSSVVLIGRLAIFRNINIQIRTTPYKGIVFDTNNLDMESSINGKHSRVEHVKIAFNDGCQEATLIGITVDSGADVNNMPICTGNCYQIFNDIVVDSGVYYGTGIKMTLIQRRAFTEATKLGFPWITHISYNDIYLGCPFTAIKAGVENTSGSAYFNRISMGHILFNNVSSQCIDSNSTRYFLDVNHIGAFLTKCIGWDYHHSVDEDGNILKPNKIGEGTNLSFNDSSTEFGNGLLQSCDFVAENESEFTVEENPSYFMDKYFKGTFVRDGYDSVDVKIDAKLTDAHIGDVAEEKINEILYSGYNNLLEHPLTQLKKDYRFSNSGQAWVYEAWFLTIIIPIVKGGNIIRWLSDICNLNNSYQAMFFFNDDELTEGTYVGISPDMLVSNDTDMYLNVPNPSGYKYVSIPFRYKEDVSSENMVITINQKITGNSNADSYTKYLQDSVMPAIVSAEVARTAQPKGDYALKSNAESWTFTLADGSTVTKKVVLV